MKYHHIIIAFLFINGYQCYSQSLKPVNYADITIEGELKTRAQKNYNRLESDTYSTVKSFPLNSKTTMVEWPGDMEGRIMLGLVLQAQATHRKPKYLQEMIKLIPERVNTKGYFGPVQGNVILEQQLSGNGWFLRALCEYYNWKKDPKIKGYIKDIIDNLALPTRGNHKSYPLDPSLRKKNIGAASGTTQATAGKWQLSTDVGCDFIFMDGVVEAYQIVPSSELKSLIDEMIARFLEMDLKAINAQTHATLTGIRAMLRYYSYNKQPFLLKEAKKRYDLYRSNAMTANFENFNWFGRPEWTEPCAIVDSYMAAVQLWQFTKEPLYLEDAHHIYYNAISNTQRANGGFGLSNCPVPDHNSLMVNTDEAWWCCTMRGGEGLANAIRDNYFVGPNLIVVPFFNNSEANIRLNNNTFKLKQLSEYPFNGEVSFEVKDAGVSLPVTFQFVAPNWTKNHRLLINGLVVPFKIMNGFVTFKTNITRGTKILLTFDMENQISHMVNSAYSKPNFYTISYGPLLLGCDISKNAEISFLTVPDVIRLSDREWEVKGKAIKLLPVYHLLDPNVNKKSGYIKQILFKIGDSK